VQRLKDALGVGQETGTYLGQTDASAGALEQALAEVSLEGLNACGDRRLSQKQGLGSPAKATLIGDLNEGFQLTQIHKNTPPHRACLFRLYPNSGDADYSIAVELELPTQPVQ
jgi:hypothetical protein